MIARLLVLLGLVGGGIWGYQWLMAPEAVVSQSGIVTRFERQGRIFPAWCGQLYVAVTEQPGQPPTPVQLRFTLDRRNEAWPQVTELSSLVGREVTLHYQRLRMHNPLVGCSDVVVTGVTNPQAIEEIR